MTTMRHFISIVEKAPPGKKAERFIRKHKAEFKKRYGKKRGENILYATAWKQFGESACQHAERLIELARSM